MHLSSVLFTAFTAITAVASLPAQTPQVLRGKVEDVPTLQNQFYLDGTNIPVRSRLMNLDKIVGLQSILKVVDVGVPGATVLEVLSASPTAKTFEMGNLRIGRTARWQVIAPPGSFASIYVAPTAATTWMPFNALGVWLLGKNFLGMGSGVTNAAGQFDLNVTTPNVPALVGTSFTGQALGGDASAPGLQAWSFTNVEAKTFEQ